MTDFDVFVAKKMLKEAYEDIQAAADRIAQISKLLSQEPQQATPTPPQQQQPASSQQPIPKGLMAAAKDQFRQPPNAEAKQPLVTNSLQSLEDVRMMFPEEFDMLLNFTDCQTYVMIAPKQFLGSEYFARIAGIVRAVKGEYVSAGKASHYRVYKGDVN
jgi:hypothetical protein